MLKAFPSILLLVFLPLYSFAGEWNRLSANTISFAGEIEEGVEFIKFQSVFTPEIRRIIVNSPGGNTITGLRIGQALIANNVEVEVRGICMSACANYIFGAASKRIISNGVVGFHGNMQAAVAQQEKIFANLHQTYPREFKDHDPLIMKLFFADGSLTDQQVLDLWENYKSVAIEEKEFFQKLGISQELFDRAQRSDKGMGDKKQYSMWLPTSKSFLQFGFKNIEGEQSLEVMNTDPGIIENTNQGYPIIYY